MSDLLTFADWRQLVIDWCAFWPVFAFMLFGALLEGGTRKQVGDLPGEMHHGYLGLLVLLVPGVPWWGDGIGFVLLAEDALVHAFRVFLFRPDFHGPIHRAYQRVFGALHRKLVAWWMTR
jgi:hypothetical protein